MSEVVVPKGWKISTMGEISEIKGSTSKLPTNESDGEKLHFIKVSDMNLESNSKYILNTTIQVKTKNQKVLENSIPPGAILIPKRGGAILTNKKRITTEKSLLDPNVMAIIPKQMINSEFLYYYFLNLDLKIFVGSEVVPQLNKYDIEPLTIKFPKNLETQEKIVAKLDHILGQLEEKKKVILEIIIKNEKSINKVYDMIHGEIITKYFESKEILEHSKFYKIKDICSINPSKSELSEQNESLEVSFVPMKAVDDVDGFIKSPEIRTLGEVKSGFTYFRENDIIFAKITPCMENGKSALGKNLKNKIGFGSTEFHVLRPKEMVLPEWIYYFVRQNKFRKDAEKVMTGSAGQQRVPKSFIEYYDIPIPPISIQKKVIQELNKSKITAQSIQNNFKPLMDRLAKTKTHLINLQNSVLEQAFSGNLVN